MQKNFKIKKKHFYQKILHLPSLYAYHHHVPLICKMEKQV